MAAVRVPFRVRYRTSRAIFGQSMTVLRRERDLWLFPVLATLALVLGMGGAIGVVWLLFGTGIGGTPLGPFGILLLLPLAFPFTFLATLMQSALAFCVHERLSGRGATRRDGLRRAWSQRGPILRFALVGLLVSGVLQTLGQVLGKLRLVPYLGTVLQSLGAFAWAAATFFVIPVLVVEREGKAVDAIRASAELARSQWGKATAGLVTIGLALMVPTLVIAFLLALAIPLVTFGGLGLAALLGLMGASIVAMLVLAGLAGAAQTTYQVGLYRFAREGKVSAPYTDATLVDAWQPYRQP